MPANITKKKITEKNITVKIGFLKNFLYFCDKKKNMEDFLSHNYTIRIWKR